jgi:hypothetical protein
LFAERGYRAVTIDRPSVHADANPDYDLYRISAAHAQDIVTVVNRANGGNLNVFLAGTSRGTLSVTAQWMLGIGAMLSSPVTAGPPGSMYIGAPGVARLQPAFVGVPAHVMAHQNDACSVTPPAGASALHEQFVAAGVPSELDQLTGGFDQSSDPAVGPCGARAFHGFLGIENTAVGEITARLDGVLARLAARFPGNRRPVARSVRILVLPRTPAMVDLKLLTGDADHDALRFGLPHATSSRGARLELRGPLAVYWPNQANIMDGFVYAVSDGHGGVSAGVVVVRVGSGFAR